MTRFLGNERGVTYLFLMFAIVLIGIATTTAAKHWKAIVQRELEADLLTKGIEIQNALAQYSSTMKAGRVVPGEVYPSSLTDLTRLPKPFLRKVYLDPMTHGDWEYVKGPTGGIMGVRSKSTAEPFRKHEFPEAVRHFDGRKQYRDWIFQYPNASIAGAFPLTNMPMQTAPNPNASNPLMQNAPNPAATGATQAGTTAPSALPTMEGNAASSVGSAPPNGAVGVPTP